MTNEQLQAIKSNPKYKELISKRSSFAWTLSVIMLVVYFSFILLIAFNPSALGATLSGSVITIGIPVGIAVILIAFILTGVYVKKANSEFDALTEEIKKEVQNG